MQALQFRKATAEDVGFLARAVQTAERVRLGDDRTIYESVFGLTQQEVEEFVVGALAREGGEGPLTYRNFCVLAREDAPVACCSAWIEAMQGVPSGHIVGTAVSRFIGARRWRERAAGIRALARAAPRRTPLALQLESFFVDPSIRGRGATGLLISGVLRKYAARDQAPEQAEISLFSENESAVRAYAKAGFEVAWRTEATTALFSELTGSLGFLQMRRALG